MGRSKEREAGRGKFGADLSRKERKVEDVGRGRKLGSGDCCPGCPGVSPAFRMCVEDAHREPGDRSVCGLEASRFYSLTPFRRDLRHAPRHSSRSFSVVALLACAAAAHAIGRLRFIATDPATGKPIDGAVVIVTDPSGKHAPVRVVANEENSFDPSTWADSKVSANPYIEPIFSPSPVTTILLPLNKTIEIQTQGQIPTKDIYIKVVAMRIRSTAAAVSGAQERSQAQIQKFGGGSGAAGANSLVKNEAGAASDSNGQQHVRGEHAEIAYVVDGVMLPDTLSGRQGAIVVPSTVDTLEILEGAYPPQFGGQTAAVLNVTTLPGSRKFKESVAIDGGTFNSYDGDLTAVGPLGKNANFTFDLQGSRTGVYQEPEQPNNETAHNTGAYYSIFTKLQFTPSTHDVLSLTLSHNPDGYQDSNRTGLSSAFADVGQGYGFMGLRDANGAIPNPINPGGFGSASMTLPSQQVDHMDIDSNEENEFAVLSWRKQIDPKTYSLLSVTGLHSGQSVTNNNAAVDQTVLPVDNSVEYNPNVTRNIHHLQETGDITSQKGAHELKAGFLLDQQSGNESYNIASASQLALDELANLDPLLAPAGSDEVSGGKKVLDVYGNPVYLASNNTIPTLLVHRSGSYDAAYAQDTWRLSKKFVVNYGLRFDAYRQSNSLSQTPVSSLDFSPRVNFSYLLDKNDTLRWSYNRLFNTPPLAEGAIVGAPIVPEILDQYDASIERNLGHGQDLKLAYYAKLIKDQVDTGLLVPGSDIGLYSALNFQRGGVHGLEVTYDLYAPKGVGWDGFLNYSYSQARPGGLDNTGAPVPEYNDHDQRNTLGAGLAYTWKNQSNVAAVFDYGSGLASSIIRDNERVPRTELDLRYSSSPTLFDHHGGYGIDIENLMDARTVINFESGFSGTRFMEGRRITFSLFAHF